MVAGKIGGGLDAGALAAQHDGMQPLNVRLAMAVASGRGCLPIQLLWQEVRID